MAISPWLTFEKIKEYENRIATLEAEGGRPLAPSTQVAIDQVGGDDSNSGLGSGNAVQTTTRLIEVLATYDWGDQDVSLVTVTPLTSVLFLEGSGLIGIKQFTLSFCTFESVVIIDNWFNEKVRLNSCTFNDGSGVTARDCHFVEFDTCTFLNITSGVQLGSFFRVTKLLLDQVSFNNVTLSSRCWSLTDVYSLEFDPSTFTSLTVPALFEIQTNVTNINFRTTGGITVTGSKFIFNNPNDIAGLNIHDESSIIETVPSVYPKSVFLDGDLRIPGPFADDTAAAGGGVNIGGPYYTAAGDMKVRLT